MADLPISMSAPMVRATLREIEQPGTGKTQTRRVLKPQPYPLEGRPGSWNASGMVGGRICISDRDLLDLHRKPKPGDRLWVKHEYDAFPVYFRPIPDYEGLYAAGTDGLIYRMDSAEPSPLKGSPTGDGRYFSVSLSRDGIWRTFSVHCLVATAFYGPRPFEGAHVRHLDSDIYNNRPDNLCWGTHEENWSDRKAAKAGLGESHHNVKLSEIDAAAIRASDASQRQLAKEYGVAQSTIWAVKAGKIWEYGDPAPPMHDLFKPWRSSRFMPKWASRITLLVTDVRVERLQDCSAADAIDEGFQDRSIRAFLPAAYGLPEWPDEWCGLPRDAYRRLWDSINGDGAWAANPWIVAYRFRPILGNIDQIGEAA